MVTNILEDLVEIINKVMEKAVVTTQDEDTDLQQLGMDSMVFIQIVVGIEEKYNIDFDPEYLIISEMGTLGKMKEKVEEYLES